MALVCWYWYAGQPKRGEISTEPEDAEIKVKTAFLDVRTINYAVDMYQVKHQRLPDTIDALVPNEIRGIGKDPWGNPYVYLKSDDSYEVLSYGPDGVQGGGDDISSNAVLGLTAGWQGAEGAKRGTENEIEKIDKAMAAIGTEHTGITWFRNGVKYNTWAEMMNANTEEDRRWSDAFRGNDRARVLAQAPAPQATDAGSSSPQKDDESDAGLSEAQQLEQFTAAKPQVERELAEAKDDSRQRRWGAADYQLRLVENDLRGFGKAVRSRADFRAMTKARDALLNRVEPEYQREEDRYERKQRREWKKQQETDQEGALFGSVDYFGPPDSFASEFSGNEVAATAKFRGARIGIKGTVARIEINAWETEVVRLYCDDCADFATLHMKADQHKGVASLRRGESVRTACVGARWVFRSLVADDCELR